MKPNPVHAVDSVSSEHRPMDSVMCAHAAAPSTERFNRPLWAGPSSHHSILIRALCDALLTFKPRPLTVTRQCLTTYVPGSFIADP